MKFYGVLLFIFFCELLLQIGNCQKKEKRIAQRNEKNKQKAVGQNKIRAIHKKIKLKRPKLRKERVFLDKDLKPTFIMTQVLDKGHFQKPAETLMLASGQSIELRCKGNNIGWNYPPYLNNSNHSRFSIVQQQKYSQLTVTNARAADTGEYSCWVILCDGLECSKDDLRMGKTYIFVADPSELFVPSTNYFDIIYLRSDGPSVIPCRVSTPLANVTLHREIPPQELTVDGSVLSYDAKQGFVIHKPSLEQKGVVYCMASLEGTPQISSNYLLLYTEATSAPPSTSIEASSNAVAGGDQVNVTCTVVGDPDEPVDFTWKYPGQWDERPVIITEKWRLIDRNNGHTVRLSKSMLYIDDIETIDVGDYICIARNLIGETIVATQIYFY
ncbi:platelet-derived growth factor receptor-like protein isoform X1 [Stegostoma tigrinum]|uniref:platelet-derived growth factor receptor-like protein isoform X1 n=1 Tax=Stegostoma tigrinum TaxID=3053191 RepID=UPI00202B825F|nr:platelet-derived growth factor receptor-like protein isoform X1 [Stegostoma tigrinum]